MTRKHTHSGPLSGPPKRNPLVPLAARRSGAGAHRKTRKAERRAATIGVYTDLRKRGGLFCEGAS